jgi:hypothetical protein
MPSSLEILPVENREWAVRYEGDPTELSRHPDRGRALTEARSHAREFGCDRIVVHDLDDERHVIPIDPDQPADTPADVKGPAAG